MAKQEIKLQKLVSSPKQANKDLNRNFDEVSKSKESIDENSIINTYEEVFYDIPKKGKLSHESIIEKSYHFLNPERRQYIEDEIENKQQILIEKNNELFELQSPSLKEHPIYPDGTLIRVNPIDTSGTNLQNAFLMQDGLKRYIANDKMHNIIRRAFGQPEQDFTKDIIFIPLQEAIFIDEGQVIKYFKDSEKCERRIFRIKHLNGHAPQVVKLNDNMYAYSHISGKLLSNVLNDKILHSVLDFYKNKFAIERFNKTNKFLSDCKDMYYTKTYDRIKLFANGPLDKIKYINGVKVPSILELLDKINWNSIYDNSIPSRFHGDFQPENIIYDTNYSKDFKLIDWRESFGESIDIGDLYYDLGKLYHALIINGQIVLKKGYNYTIESNKAYIDYNTKSNLVLLLNYFKDFCKENELNWDNVELLGILQYIGICTLYKDFHEGKYGEFLFLLGKYLLTKKLNNERIN